MEKNSSSAALVVAVALVAFGAMALVVAVSGCNLFINLVR